VENVDDVDIKDVNCVDDVEDVDTGGVNCVDDVDSIISYCCAATVDE
jgi:hypothetical protein